MCVYVCVYVLQVYVCLLGLTAVDLHEVMSFVTAHTYIHAHTLPFPPLYHTYSGFVFNFKRAFVCAIY